MPVAKLSSRLFDSMKLQRRWPWLLLLLPIAIGLARLKFDSEVLDLLPGDLPVVQGLKLYQQHFSNARDLVITVRGADAEQTERAARTIAEKLRSQSNLVSEVTWEPPWLEHPGQVGELLAYLWLNQPSEYLQQLADRLAPGNVSNTLFSAREQLATTLSPEEMARLSYDPFGFTRLPEQTMNAAPSFGRGQEMFSSPDGKFRILFTQAAHDLPNYRDAAKWLEAVRGQVESALNADPELTKITTGFTGPPAFVSEIAKGMEHDMTSSVIGTSIIIAILFWLAHRRWKPMIWLLILLGLILGTTLALGGLIFGKIYVVSIGFAAILLGLAVDYAVVHYQEALAHPDFSIPQIRRAIAPSIFWAAVTTISAFLVLNFGGLPGLAQLGSLVGLGVAISACIMIFAFLPPLFPGRMQPRAVTPAAHETPHGKAELPGKTRVITVMSVTSGIGVICLVILAAGLPKIDATANALRPQNSRSYAALEEIKRELNENREPLWLVVAGHNENEVAARLRASEPALLNAVSNGTLAGFTLPLQLWPDPQHQSDNRALASNLAAQRDRLHGAAAEAGFTETSLGLADEILRTWQSATSTRSPFWPGNPMSRWIFQKVTARSTNQLFALGFLNPPAGTSLSARGISILEAELPHDQVWLSGWELLGSGIFASVKRNLWKLITPMVLLVCLSLWLAFRRWKEILLSIAVLLFSGLCLLTIMRLAGWSWNLLNLMALPLILGTGVDYSIFIQLALRRYHGDLRMAHRSVGRALFLCGATAIAGFGSLAWSNNAGMASLGKICAVGIAGNMMASVLLLPIWWRLATGTGGLKRNAAAAEVVSQPSSLYRAHFWRLGLWIVRVLPARLCMAISRFLARIYWHLAPHRRTVVIGNLQPALNGNPVEAIQKARSLFDQFAIKLIDLWRYEAGQSIEDLFGQSTGWEHFETAHQKKRGVLLLTVHLGNWELGGPWLTERGFPLKIITLAEPGAGFTQLRQASRSRWKVETLVIGDDPFGFLEVIRRLEAGETVALLVDRPPLATSVEVELFGRPFPASVAAAELARASGCELVPVYLPRMKNSYAAHILPPIPYDRAALRDRLNRVRLTGEIMRAFEPAIRQNIEQWFHFINVWPKR